MPYRDESGGDLATRLETELRQRIEEAIDAACLDIMVSARQTRGLPVPAADNERDRAEYHVEVRRFLERLDSRLAGLLGDEFKPEPKRAAPGPIDPSAPLIATQTALARSLPDYWQRFDAIRLEYAAERSASGGESRGFLRRVFGLG